MVPVLNAFKINGAVYGNHDFGETLNSSFRETVTWCQYITGGLHIPMFDLILINASGIRCTQRWNMHKHNIGLNFASDVTPASVRYSGYLTLALRDKKNLASSQHA